MIPCTFTCTQPEREGRVRPMMRIEGFLRMTHLISPLVRSGEEMEMACPDTLIDA